MRFSTPDEAAAHLAPLLDRPVTPTRTDLAPGIVFQAEPLHANGRFTNSYRLSWHGPARARIFVTEPPVSAREFAERHGNVATTTAGFFFLADRCRFRPRALSLNLAIQDGRVLSLPVADQDALISQNGALTVVNVPAGGELSLDGHALTWAGSRTTTEADCYTYGNANSVIRHEADEQTGKIRVFQEDSRFTPETGPGWSDLGFRDNEAVAQADGGRLDIFEYDLVLRCPQRLARIGARLQVHTIGGLVPRKSLQGAISVGPALSCPDVYKHPLNEDRSLGSFPLLRERPSTRLVFAETSDGWQHLCLFDGRPGSPTFPGITLGETISMAHKLGTVTNGCLLDSGHTSKLNVRLEDTLRSFGNRHYLRWPGPQDEHFTWTPDQGRPAASLIALD